MDKECPGSKGGESHTEGFVSDSPHPILHASRLANPEPAAEDRSGSDV